MHKYHTILVLHPIDSSTEFLRKIGSDSLFKYYPFKADQSSEAIIELGDLTYPSLIVFLGHGSSTGLFKPDETHIYKDYFLDVDRANHYFENHDVLLLSCRSNDFILKINKASSLIGFGNIISSMHELDIYNEQSKEKKNLTSGDIDKFNEIYIDIIKNALGLLLSGSINFCELRQYISFYINKEIIRFLKGPERDNNIGLVRLLFEFRNDLRFKSN